MKKLTMMIAVLASACTTTGDDSPDPFVGTPAQAKHAIADAYCSRMRECSPVSFDESYVGGIAQCDAETESWMKEPAIDATECIDSLAHFDCRSTEVFVLKCSAWEP